MRVALMMLALAWGSAASGQAVYRCDVGGKFAFQDTPCAGTASDQNKIDATPKTSGLGGVHSVDLVRQGELRAAISKRQVMMGMTAEQVRQAWGRPSKINSSSGGRDQWVYQHGPGEAQYVYFQDGLVDAWN